jgi:hypothetical protein
MQTAILGQSPGHVAWGPDTFPDHSQRLRLIMAFLNGDATHSRNEVRKYRTVLQDIRSKADVRTSSSLQRLKRASDLPADAP